MDIQIVKGDITKVSVDVIVNAANTSLMGGGGVDGAIHRAGGKSILDECIAIRNSQGGCKVGEAVITTGGDLRAKKVIHTVGPKWNGGRSNEPELLRSCYVKSLELAETIEFRSIAFPNISTGIYGYPKEEAARIVYDVVKAYPFNSLETLIFVCFDKENHGIYKDLFKD